MNVLFGIARAVRGSDATTFYRTLLVIATTTLAAACAGTGGVPVESIGSAQAAAERNLTSRDQSIIADLKEKPDWGILIMDVTTRLEGKEASCGATAYFKNAEGKRGVAQISNIFVGGKRISSGSIQTVKAGTYVIHLVECQLREKLSASFAEFTLKPGEILNAGNLVIDYKPGSFLSSEFSARTRVEALSAETVASVKERAPVAFAKATSRYMKSLLP